MLRALGEAEQRMQIDRARRLLDNAQDVVWGNYAFPEEDRPDIAHLRHSIIIADQFPSHLTLHPDLIDEARLESEAILENESTIGDSAQIAWYDATTRNIIIRPVTILMPNHELARVLFHEAATDISDRQRTLKPDEYSPEQETLVREALATTLKPDTAQRFEDTSIAIMGYREILMSGQYAIGDLTHFPFLHALSEVYPLVHEFVTQQLLLRGGNISRFETDIESGEIQVTSDQALHHPRFLKTLIASLRVAGWRNVLRAFRSGSLEETIAIMDGGVTNSEYSGGDVASALIMDLHADESAIAEFAEKID